MQTLTIGEKNRTIAITDVVCRVSLHKKRASNCLKKKSTKQEKATTPGGKTKHGGRREISVYVNQSYVELEGRAHPKKKGKPL